MSFTGKGLEHVLSRSLTSGRRPYAARSTFPGPIISAALHVPTGHQAAVAGGSGPATPGASSAPERAVRATSGVSAELTAVLRAARQMNDWEAALSAVQLVCHDHAAASGGGAATLATHQLALLFATLREVDLRIPPLASADPLTPIAVAGPSTGGASGATPRLDRVLHALDSGAAGTPSAEGAAIVSALAEAGAWDAALRRFQPVAAAPVAAHAAAAAREALNACISACAQPGQWAAALQLAARPMRLRTQLGAAAAVKAVGAEARSLPEVEAVGPVADAVTYASLVSVLEACGRREELKQVLAVAPSADRASIDASYVALIDVWSGRHASSAMRRF